MQAIMPVVLLFLNAVYCQMNFHRHVAICVALRLALRRGAPDASGHVSSSVIGVFSTEAMPSIFDVEANSAQRLVLVVYARFSIACFGGEPSEAPSPDDHP